MVFFLAQLVALWAVNIFGASQQCGAIFFWVLGPVLTVGMFVWLSLSYGPVLDLVGYIVVSAILYLATILKMLFYSEDDKNSK